MIAVVTGLAILAVTFLAAAWLGHRQPDPRDELTHLSAHLRAVRVSEARRRNLAQAEMRANRRHVERME